MTDSDELRDIRLLIRRCGPALKVQTKSGIYPYDIGSQLEMPGKFSTSTNSMVAHSVASVAGLIPASKLVGVRLPSDRGVVIDLVLLERVKTAVSRIVQQLMSPSEGDSPLWSSAFGTDDPFTLGWLIELLGVAENWTLTCSEDDRSAALDLALTRAVERVNAALKNPSNPVLVFPDTKAGRAVLHPLPLLRLLQVATIVDQYRDQPLEAAFSTTFEWFLTHLHLQLSRRSIEHGGFDIAELVFSLEGMVVSNHSRVTDSILDSVVDALNDSRQLNSTLRSTTPFKVTSTGAVHLFTSIEVVASLLRSVAAMDEYRRTRFFRKLKPTLRHYVAWLQATMLNVETALPSETVGSDKFPEDTPLQVFGWQSEHAHTEENLVHVWLTSQVLVFLRSYETLLAEDQAASALSSAGLQARTYPRSDHTIDEQLEHARRDDSFQLQNASPYRVVSRLYEHFVEPRKKGAVDNAAHSCLLYGPPGTGKTTLARQLAQALDWPLLTITTSDFIIDGEAQVEARAKAVFETLMLQFRTVIFFDEIDRLVLDRDTRDYMRQGDMLQFMTPSMLTKFNDLRSEQRSIFIVGTNYADRIDSAIKRVGRIDHHLVVMPPDLARRRNFISEQVATQLLGISDEEIDDAAKAGVGRTIAELMSAIQRFARYGGSLVASIEAVEPAVSLATYRKRIEVSEGSFADASHELLEEAYLLAYLYLEVDSTALGSERNLLSDNWVAARARRVIKDDHVVSVLDREFSNRGNTST